MKSESHERQLELSSRLSGGDRAALEQLLASNRDRLKRMVALRLAPELGRRVDESDIVQEAFLQAALNVDNYRHDPERPFYLWIRKITENKLIEAHRKHVKAGKRGLHREKSIDEPRVDVSSAVLANVLVDSSVSGPITKVIRSEAQQLLRNQLDELEEVDREVLVMRHFEELSLSEIGAELGMTKAGAAKRYRKAVERLRVVLDQYPGLL